VQVFCRVGPSAGILYPLDFGPGWLWEPREEWSGPISRVLSRASICLGRQLPDASSGQPGADAAPGQRRSPKGLAPYSALLRAGFGQPVCHHTAGALLPHHFTLAHLAAGGVVSVPLSVGSPRLGVTQRPALWSSDFPQPPLGDRGRLAHSTAIVPQDPRHRHQAGRAGGP